MSANNYIVLRKFPEGWYWGMGFASDSYPNNILPKSSFRNGPFETMIRAQEHAEADVGVIEYGFRTEDQPFEVECFASRNPEVLAIQYTEETREACIKFCDADHTKIDENGDEYETLGLVIRQRHQTTYVFPKEWIVKDSEGHFLRYEDKDFAELFKKIDHFYQ